MVQRVSEKLSEMDLITQATSAAIVPVTDGGASYKAPITGLLPFADVRMYGTTGTTDDSATLTAALAAVATGGSVIVPAGVTLTVTNVTLNGKRITGPGTLKWKAGASTAMLTLSGTSPTLDGLTIDGESLDHSTNVAVVTSSATQPRLNNLRILNFRYKFFLSDVANSPGGQVSSCYIYNCGQVTDCDIFGIRSSRWSFSQCDFEHVTAAGHMIRFGQYDIGTNVPVVDSRVTNCSFYDSVEVGIVCELYTQGIEIASCTFRTLDQGVKCENSGSTVSGVNIIGCEFRGLTLSTGFNWTVPGTFANNRCYDCACGIEIFKDAIVTGNYLENCGTSSEGAIHLFTGGSGRFIISNNMIVNPVGSGIVLGTANAVVQGNTIHNVSLAGKFGIDVDKDNQKVNNNVINTVAAGCTGLRVVSTCTNSQVTQNTFLNLTGSGLTVTNSASFLTCLVKDNIGIATLALDHNIVSGAFTIGLSSVDVVMNTEGGAATDDLDTMTATTNLPKGHIVVLRDNSSSNDVTVKHNTGNILLAGGADFTLLTSSYHIGLQWSGTKWQELWRATA